VQVSDLHFILEIDEYENVSAGFQQFRNGKSGTGTVESVAVQSDASVSEATQAFGEVVQTRVGTNFACAWPWNDETGLLYSRIVRGAACWVDKKGNTVALMGNLCPG
jgi:hypothetical protein